MGPSLGEIFFLEDLAADGAADGRYAFLLVAKDLIPFLTGVRLAAARQTLVGLLQVVLMIKRPEGLLPEALGDGRAPRCRCGVDRRHGRPVR